MSLQIFELTLKHCQTRAQKALEMKKLMKIQMSKKKKGKKKGKKEKVLKKEVPAVKRKVKKVIHMLGSVMRTAK